MILDVGIATAKAKTNENPFHPHPANHDVGYWFV